jgi:hypothetical protein
VTALQTQSSSSHTSPNVAILAKLREEMLQLANMKKNIAPIGKLTLNNSMMTPGENQGCIQRIDL